MAAYPQYLWIAVLAGIFGFMYGFLIGANDVANAFASSVASKSITLKQAVIIASFCEFGGAYLLGAAVTSTVRSKIFDVDLYEDTPDVLMFGMFTSLFSANVWLFIATYLAMPVSTTHDIVGCIMGFTIACKGFSSVEWSIAGKIFISWIASPLVAGTVAASFFACVKHFVMHAKDPFQRTFYTFPIVLTIGIGVDLFYVLYKGVAKWDVEDTIKPSWGIPMSFAIGAFFGVLWILIFGPIAKRRVEARMAAKNAERGEVKQLEEDAKADVEDGDFEQFSSFVYDKEAKAPQDVAPAVVKEEVKVAVVAPAEPVEAPKPTTLLGKLASNTWDQDLHTQSMHESHKAQEIWDTEEQFDENAESLFTFIQVFTACLNSFAHGANDVANTIAPMSAVIDIYQNGEVHSKTGVQRWLLAYGGLAIVLGLLLYGYRVMKSIGYKLTMMSPSRGSSAELGASLTVVTASFLGIPVSSTQCIVGAVTGVGLVGGKQSLNWWFFLTICCSWVGLFFVATTFSAGVFSFAYYAPGLVSTTSA